MTVWKDTIKDQYGNVIERGTPINAANLNRIEAGLAEAGGEIDEAKGSFLTLREKLDNIVISGGGATSLSSLTDVVLSNANEGDVLSLSEGKWVPKTINVGSGSNIPSDAQLFIENGVLYYEHSGVSTLDFTLNENGELVVTY